MFAMDDDVAAELEDPMMDDPTDLRNTKNQVMNFIYEIPYFSRSLHKWENRSKGIRRRVYGPSGNEVKPSEDGPDLAFYYQPISRFIEEAEMHLETFLIYMVSENDEIEQKKQENVVGGFMGALVRMITEVGPEYTRVRSIMRLPCAVRDRYRSALLFWKKSNVGEAEKAQYIQNCAKDLAREVKELVTIDGVVLKIGDLLLRTKDADDKDLKKAIQKNSRYGELERMLVNMEKKDNKHAYDGIKVINMGEGPSDRILYLLIALSNLRGGKDFLAQFLQLMKYEDENIKINREHRKEKLAVTLKILGMVTKFSAGIARSGLGPAGIVASTAAKALAYKVSQDAAEAAAQDADDDDGEELGDV
jgi:hypothetical protein